MLAAWRDRLLGSARFQHLAARFPLTRPIARREARALFELCAGTVYAQTLAACLELDLFGRLASPRTAAQLAADLPLSAERLAPLIEAGTALRLLRRQGDRIGLGALGAALRANPGIAAMVAHHRMLHADLADPVAMLANPGTGQLARFWPYATSAQGQGTAAYTALMAESLPLLSGQVRDAYDFRRHSRLLDVGGGDGGFLSHILRATPALRGTVLDLPEVAQAARTRLAADGLADRATAVGADFRTDPFPPGADLITFVRVLHDHDDPTVQHLLSAARSALPPGGTLLIAEPMADDPPVAAYFSLYLAAMGSGRPRRVGEIRRMLRQAGFTAPRVHRTSLPLLCRVIAARA